MRAGEERVMLESLIDVEHKLSDWESQFIESIADRLDSGRDLTPAQLDKLTQIYEKRVLGY